MRTRTGSGMQQSRHLWRWAGVVLAGSLVLSGCSGDDSPEPDAGGTAQSPTGADTDGDGIPDAAPQTGDGGTETAAAPAGPPTAPADIAVEPGERSASGGNDVTVEGDRAAFVTPTGNVACTVNAGAAVCQVSDKVFQVQGGHMVADVLGGCTAAEADGIMTSEGGAWTCLPQPLAPQAAVDQGGWWSEEVDGTTTQVDDLTVAVLPYGSSLTVGSVTCSSAESGVTCRNGDLGRQFSVSRNNYNYGS